MAEKRSRRGHGGRSSGASATSLLALKPQLIFGRNLTGGIEGPPIFNETSEQRTDDHDSHGKQDDRHRAAPCSVGVAHCWKHRAFSQNIRGCGTRSTRLQPPSPNGCSRGPRPTVCIRGTGSRIDDLTFDVKELRSAKLVSPRQHAELAEADSRPLGAAGFCHRQLAVNKPPHGAKRCPSCARRRPDGGVAAKA